MQRNQWQDIKEGKILALDTQKFKQLLEAERDALQSMDETAAAGRAPVELDQQSVGRLSRMDALQVQAMAQAMGTRREGRFAQIEAALKRIENNDYGMCLECDVEIPVKRLEIDPAVATCVKCVA